MKIKTSELIGHPLDWAVATALGLIPRVEWQPLVTPKVLGICVMVNGRIATFNPSIDGNQGIQIIEREKIGLDQDDGVWSAYHPSIRPKKRWWRNGPTPLIAAMRCFVASKLGDEVEIPEELL